MHLIGHLERLAKVEVHQGVHSQELNTDQVLLLVVVVRACAHNIIQVFPEGNKYSSSFICLLYVIGIDLEGRQIWGKTVT